MISLKFARAAVATALFSAAALAEVIIPTSTAISAATNRPAPEYTALARNMKLAGDVVVEVKIAEDGTVSGVKPISGSALLAKGVISTVKQWKFKPFESGGKPAAAITTLRFSFKP